MKFPMKEHNGRFFENLVTVGGCFDVHFHVINYTKDFEPELGKRTFMVTSLCKGQSL